MISRKVEIWWPCAAAGVSAAAVALWADEIPAIPDLLAAGTITLGVVVAGFTATQRNMLLSITGTRVMRLAVEAGYDKDVIDCLRHCVWASLLLVAISVVRFFVDDCAWQEGWGRVVWLPVWSGAFVLVLALMVRNERMMFLVVSRSMRG